MMMTRSTGKWEARHAGRYALPSSWAREDAFYEQLSFCDVTHVFRFVNEQCQFVLALTPPQPRHAKQVADTDSLMAVFIAQAMNYGNLVMSRTSDIPYLESGILECPWGAEIPSQIRGRQHNGRSLQGLCDFARATFGTTPGQGIDRELPELQRWAHEMLKMLRKIISGDKTGAKQVIRRVAAQFQTSCWIRPGAGGSVALLWIWI
jgi:hypothetical protein